MHGVDEVAVKALPVGAAPAVVKRFKSEMDVASGLRHRNIVQFYGASADHMFIVSELMEGGAHHPPPNTLPNNLIYIPIYRTHIYTYI